MDILTFRKILTKHQKSKLSLKDFCFQEGIKLHVFRYWKKKLDDSISLTFDSPQNPFIEVSNVQSQTKVRHHGLECISPSGFRILIPQEFNLEDLQKLLVALS